MELKYGSVCSGVEAAGLAWLPLGWKCLWLAEVEPFPSEVLMQRFGATKPIRPLEIEHGSEGDAATRRAWRKAIAAMPDGGTLPNYGDFTRITPEEAFGIDVLVGGTPCFPAGTLVLTEFGYRPIEEIKCGDRVVSGEGRLCAVTCRGVKEAPTISVDSASRPSFRATPNHPFLMRRGKRVAAFAPIGEAAKGDSICHLAPAACMGKIEIPAIPEDPDYDAAAMLELAGWYLAVGDAKEAAGGWGITLAVPFANADAFVVRYPHLFDYRPRLRPISSGVKEIYAGNSRLPAAWLVENFGGGDCPKRIPAWCYALPEAERLRLIAGYRAARSGKTATVPTALAFGLADLAPGNAAVSLTALAHMRTIHWDETGNAFDNNYAIRKIENGTTEPVFNLTVDGDHTYIVESKICHNCQDLSIAGKQKGFSGQRSVLALDFVRLAYESKCKWVVWENVPGVFSANGGADFATFLSLLCGKEIRTPKGGWKNAGFVRSGNDGRFSLAWRVLDAQYARVDGFEYAVPQRRKRVFVVGHLGDDTYPAEVLLEPEMLFGDNPPRREKIKGNPAFAADGASEPDRDTLGGGIDGGARGNGCCQRAVGGAGGAGAGIDAAAPLGEPADPEGKEAVSFLPGFVKRSESCHWGVETSTTLQADAHGDNRTAVAVFGAESPEAGAVAGEGDANGSPE